MFPSATNKTVTPTKSSPFFTYSINDCTHSRIGCGNPAVKATLQIFKRDRMLAPATTMVFCEEPEDNFSETSGVYETVTRHSGGCHFVMGDGHVEWLTYNSFCRECPAYQFSWTDSTIAGDWSPSVTYHWWFFPGAAAACD